MRTKSTLFNVQADLFMDNLCHCFYNINNMKLIGDMLQIDDFYSCLINGVYSAGEFGLCIIKIIIKHRLTVLCCYTYTIHN